MIQKGLKIGLFDCNNIELALGDNVSCLRETVLPNWDGWGRDIPKDGPTTYQVDSYHGQVVYEQETYSFKIETTRGLRFSPFMFKKIEKVFDK